MEDEKYVRVTQAIRLTCGNCVRLIRTARMTGAEHARIFHAA